MLTKIEIINFLRSHFEYLNTKYSISKIGLIGSFARNEQKAQSDIDLLVEFKPGTQHIYETKIALKEFLRSHFKRDIDICREKYLKPYVRDVLLKEVIYVR